jgi:hypothetical protein
MESRDGSASSVSSCFLEEDRSSEEGRGGGGGFGPVRQGLDCRPTGTNALPEMSSLVSPVSLVTPTRV